MTIISDCLTQLSSNTSSCWTVLAGFSGLYQDPDGFTPVTALGQSVGLMLNTAALPPQAKRYNLFTHSHQFAQAVWGKARATISANTVTNHLGATVAYTLVEDTTASASHFMSQAVTVTAGKDYIFSLWVKYAGRQFVRLSFGATAFPTLQVVAYFDLLNGVTRNVTAGANASITPQGDGWYLITLQTTATASATDSTHIALSADGASLSYTGDGVSGAHLFGAQLTEGTVPLEYQAITSSWMAALGVTYASQPTASLRPTVVASSTNMPVLQFDGVDDYLTSTYTIPSGTAHTITLAGYTNGSNQTAFGQTSATANTALTVGSNASGLAYAAVGSAAPAFTLAGNAPFVLTIVRSGASASLYLNGILATTVSGVTVAFSNLPFFLGALNNNGVAANFWNGQIAFISVTRTALSNTQRLLVERYAAALIGKAIYIAPTYTFPSDICPTSATPPLSYSPTLVSVSQSLKRQARSLFAHRWQMDVAWDKLTKAQHGRLTAFLNQCRGQYGVVEVPIMGLYGGNAGNQQAPVNVISTLAIAADNCALSGFTVNGLVLQAGSFIRFAGHTKVYQVTQDVEAYGGVATVTFFPKTLAAVSAGEAVKVYGVTLRAALTADLLESGILNRNQYSCKASFLEVL